MMGVRTMTTTSNPIVETYSRLAQEYDHELNLRSCWGKAADKALASLVIKDYYQVVLDIGCGTGRALARLASTERSGIRWIGIEPAENMRRISTVRIRGLSTVRILDGCFEAIPLPSESVDYAFSIFAFHWTTDLEASVKELRRVLKATGEMDLFFIGRNNGREFIQATSPIFLKYMGPELLLESARMRKQLTKEAAWRLFTQSFSSNRLAIEESYDTYYDTLDGHWAWWVRIEGHFMKIPPQLKAVCDQEAKTAISRLGRGQDIPYTLHQLHVRLTQV
jgi:ubiquinone/menaquinone biosynthesis C-methylase UbiE